MPGTSAPPRGDLSALELLVLLGNTRVPRAGPRCLRAESSQSWLMFSAVPAHPFPFQPSGPVLPAASFPALRNSELSPSLLCPSPPKCLRGTDQVNLLAVNLPGGWGSGETIWEGLWVSPWPGGLLTLSSPEFSRSCLEEFCLAERMTEIYTQRSNKPSHRDIPPSCPSSLKDGLSCGASQTHSPMATQDLRGSKCILTLYCT